MVNQRTKQRPSPLLLKRLEEHRVRVAQFRREHGDPAEALHDWVRQTFDREALIQSYEEYLANPYEYLETPDHRTDEDE